MTEHPALTDPEYATPGRSRGLLSAFQYRYVLSLLMKKGVATRYYGSALGWAWSYIRPIAQFLMYYVVIGILLGVNRGVEYFPVYLFSGLIMINLFSEVFRTTTDAVVSNKALVRKVYLPRELFPLASAGGAIIHFLPQATVLLIVAIFLGWTITWMQVVALLAAVVIVSVFGLGMGLAFGALNVAYRDAHNIVDLILMFTTWASPVIYVFTTVQARAPEWLFHIYMSNPVTSAVELSHTVFWDPIANDPHRPEHLWTYVLIGLGLALISIVVGQLVFRRMEGRFAQDL
ncbi:ABC transporter permease [Leucobacter sp. USHLN153]|uniref:ABC transporter permease n=1 Tax=Leucobacter sp. USHLN153 TaxID=3081268 RepID=UPI003018647B